MAGKTKRIFHHRGHREHGEIFNINGNKIKNPEILKSEGDPLGVISFNSNFLCVLCALCGEKKKGKTGNLPPLLGRGV